MPDKYNEIVRKIFLVKTFASGPYGKKILQLTDEILEDLESLRSGSQGSTGLKTTKSKRSFATWSLWASLKRTYRRFLAWVRAGFKE
jgi:hypothetical protein